MPTDPTAETVVVRTVNRYNTAETLTETVALPAELRTDDPTIFAVVKLLEGINENLFNISRALNHFSYNRF